MAEKYITDHLAKPEASDSSSEEDEAEDVVMDTGDVGAGGGAGGIGGKGKGKGIGKGKGKGKGNKKGKSKGGSRKVKAAKTAKVKRFKGPKVTLHGEELKRDPIRDKVDEMLSGMRQEFIFARLWPSCALCKKYFMGHAEDDKIQYHCNTCFDDKAVPAFDLCPKCYEAEGSSHPHPLVPQDVQPVPQDTSDRDPLIDSLFFETRVKFLNLCQVGLEALRCPISSWLARPTSLHLVTVNELCVWVFLCVFFFWGGRVVIVLGKQCWLVLAEFVWCELAGSWRWDTEGNVWVSVSWARFCTGRAITTSLTASDGLSTPAQ